MVAFAIEASGFTVNAIATFVPGDQGARRGVQLR